MVKSPRDFPGGPVVKTELPMQEARTKVEWSEVGGEVPAQARHEGAK